MVNFISSNRDWMKISTYLDPEMDTKQRQVNRKNVHTLMSINIMYKEAVLRCNEHTLSIKIIMCKSMYIPQKDVYTSCVLEWLTPHTRRRYAPHTAWIKGIMCFYYEKGQIQNGTPPEKSSSK